MPMLIEPGKRDAVGTGQWLGRTAPRAIPLRHHVVALALDEKMRMTGRDAGIQHRPADLLTARAIRGVRRIGMQHIAGFMDQRAFAGVAPHPSKAKRAIVLLQRFNLESGQPRGHETLQTVLQFDGLIQRLTAQAVVRAPASRTCCNNNARTPAGSLPNTRRSSSISTSCRCSGPCASSCSLRSLISTALDTG